MSSANRLAGLAALAIFLAFAMHALNAFYIEPRFLGFESFMDYARIDKLKNAIGSVPWRLSGVGHLLSGFAMVVLATAAYGRFKAERPLAAALAAGAAALSAAGFLLTGLADVPGSGALKLLVAQNPGTETHAYLANSLMRIAFNNLAIVGLGWFAVQLSWCGLKTGGLPRAFSYFGYFAGLTGLGMMAVFTPYLLVVPIWSLWLGILLLRSTEVAAE
jgi:hypothetical protein